MKYSIKTFGCQYNEWDAVRLSNFLADLGLIESLEDDADLIFVLNCSVRKSGVDRALGFMRNQKDKKVFVSGCILANDKKRFIDKDAILFDLDNLTDLAKNIIPQANDRYVKVHQNMPKVSQYIPIMKGCNNFCSYCAVPYTRGREVSRPFDEVINDIKKVIEAGQKEIILIGQNVNSYEFGFTKLLRETNDLSGDFIVKFTSNHPKDMTDEIIEAIAILPKIAKEIHLPLQSGSNKVLRSMNRPYTKEQYMAIIDKIKARIPNVKISSDTIVGFPTEIEDDFNETVEVLKRVNYSQVYNNKYSPREGTAAFKLGDPIPWSEKERRWRILNDITNKKS